MTKRIISIFIIFILISLLFVGCGRVANSEAIPIIIDCDPGIDDAIALCIAAKKSILLEIRALTSVFGNNTIERTSFNLLALSEYFNISSPVYVGKECSLSGTTNPAYSFHGLNGLGGVRLPITSKAPEKGMAWDVIYREAIACKGNLQIVALGPLTNIATAIQKYPELPSLINRIIIMGGSASDGNETAYAEFNAYCDPLAANIVFSSEIEIVMVGLNATNNVYLTESDMIEMLGENSKISSLFNDLCAQMRVLNPSEGGIVLHDPTAIAYVIDSSIASTYRATVEVDISDSERRGQTIVQPDDAGNVIVLDTVNNEKVFSLMEGAFQLYGKSEKDHLESENYYRMPVVENTSITADTNRTKVIETDFKTVYLETMIQSPGQFTIVFSEYFNDLNYDNFQDLFQTEHSVVLFNGDEKIGLSSVTSSVGYYGINIPFYRSFVINDFALSIEEGTTVQIQFDDVIFSSTFNCSSIKAQTANLYALNETIPTTCLNLENGMILISHDLVNISNDLQLSIDENTIGYTQKGESIIPIMFNTPGFTILLFREQYNALKIESIEVPSISFAKAYDSFYSTKLEIGKTHNKTKEIYGVPINIVNTDYTAGRLGVEFSSANTPILLAAYLGTYDELMEMALQNNINENRLGTFSMVTSDIYFSIEPPANDIIVLTIVNFHIQYIGANYLYL
ncbi:MAG: nucleoside hydrolase [Oscillospiraceae bacterium]